MKGSYHIMKEWIIIFINKYIWQYILRLKISIKWKQKLNFYMFKNLPLKLSKSNLREIMCDSFSNFDLLMFNVSSGYVWSIYYTNQIWGDPVKDVMTEMQNRPIIITVGTDFQ